MIDKQLFSRKTAAWGSVVLLLAASLAGCTSSDTPPDSPTNDQALEFEADLGTMYADVPVHFNPAQLSGGEAAEDYERLEFDAEQDVPDGMEITTPTKAELPRLCGADEVCLVADEPKLVPEQAVVATAAEDYDGGSFTLTGEAVDADGNSADFSMDITPESVEEAPGSTASPQTTPITSESGDTKLTIDFSEAMMVTRAGGDSFVTGTYTAEFPAMVLPPGGVVASNHDGDYTANEIFTSTVENNKPKVSGEKGVLAILIDETKGGVRYSIAADLTMQFPYSELLGTLYSSSPVS